MTAEATGPARGRPHRRALYGPRTRQPSESTSRRITAVRTVGIPSHTAGCTRLAAARDSGPAE